ncbi:hypothetical protein, partial [Sphingomonas sp.]|uniref:hypothetical protein n=1 Tax=Sphingomonas sp. TaxID=28214 RepID=UPI00334201CF
MVARLAKAVLALLLPFVLASCVLTPGKFVSTLRIDADRHFTFTYVGEVISVDLGGEFAKGMKDAPVPQQGTDPAAADGDAPVQQKIALQNRAAPDRATKAASEAKNRAIAAALAKEAGYRKVVYLGDGKFSIDYAMSGTLDRGFVWPYNLDAEIVFPFVVLEVRANNTVRIKAPAFANQNDAAKGMAGLDGAGKTPSQLDGSFTLDTNAEIVS